ncbi:pre-mRNA-splicing factor syf1 homolog [Planococcus citri]|uniref:pre-mRNA-splicing factor syf1 homolog n=1 Tax=Planococcus citri TaxID=170843 RepID=UPI0031F82569
MVVDTRTPRIVFNEEDLPYEEEILRNPYTVKPWMRYIDHKRDAPKNQVNVIYERALKELPGSYKLWYNYLRVRRKQVRAKCITDPAYEDANNAFERALVFMHKMPRIWIDYCNFMLLQQKITRTRRVFDRALRALPITQHNRIWPLYIKFVRNYNIPETAIRAYRRFLKYSPEDAEDYIEYLISIDRLDEAAVKLAEIVNREHFVSKHGKSNHQLWNELCELISKNPHKVRSLKVDAIIRGGIRRYTDQLGHLWNSLADYYVRSGLFERARDIYEEAIQTVTTVRDFTQIFDAYSQFEEISLAKRLEELSEDMTPEEETEVELKMARLSDIMERRMLLLNSVLLRQNPHNVQEWHKRVQLYEGHPHEIIKTYTEAVQTVEPKLAVGKLHTLWVEFAKFYESNKQFKEAAVVFQKAVEVPYQKVDDLASVWCEWAEMEIRRERYDAALKLLQKATVLPSRKVAYHDEKEPVQARVHKSLKLWSMYADLEESVGTFKSCKAVYDRIIDLKIANPQLIINYGLFLEENKYFEEAFRAYEKGISLFKWPNVFDIWNTYLSKFLNRYGGKQLDRARDLFIQCLEHCPPKFAKNFYLLYADMEEKYGLARHSMEVYRRATQAVLPEEKLEMYGIYIKKAHTMYGIDKVRQIYEEAIENLDVEGSKIMHLKFSELETKLGEIDRARAIYAHCSEMCDPRVTADFWETWTNFEVQHGSEDTLKEMLRIKRSVQASYNTQVNMMSAQMLAAAANASGTVSDLAPGAKDGMRMLEAKAAEMSAAAGEIIAAENRGPRVEISFVRGETTGGDKNNDGPNVANPDEINIDEDDDDDDDA